MKETVDLEFAGSMAIVIGTLPRPRRQSLCLRVLSLRMPIMEQRWKEVAVWLRDDTARLIVGAAPANNPSRWAIRGTIVEDTHLGLWLRTNAIQEFRPIGFGTKRVNWQSSSIELLIRWDAVITIQAFEGSDNEIGFTPAES